MENNFKDLNEILNNCENQIIDCELYNMIRRITNENYLIDLNNFSKSSIKFYMNICISKLIN
jgi:hypothetical protein